jgi:deoxycytidine triphosphate deaminase
MTRPPQPPTTAGGRRWRPFSQIPLRPVAAPAAPPSPLPPIRPAPKPQGAPAEVDAIRDVYSAEAISSNQRLDFAKDEADARRRFAGWRSWDPFPEIEPALLNAAAIADYVSATGMIYPFHAEKLKPASYEVAMQGEYLYYDANQEKQVGTMLPANHAEWNGVKNPTPTFRLNGNSIAFVSLEPLFQLPDYIAVRFNLKVKHIYKGLLLGAGPLVDPGYVGKLNIPLRNLTAEDYNLEAGKGLIWIEFTKINRHLLWDNSHAVNPRQRGRYVFFERRKTAVGRPDIESFIKDAVAPGQQPRSSLPDVVQKTQIIADKALKAANSARETSIDTQSRLRKLGLLSVVGAILAAAAVIVPTIALVHDTSIEVRTVSPRQEQQEQRIIDLENQINELKARLSEVGPVAPPTTRSLVPPSSNISPAASNRGVFMLVDLISRLPVFVAWLVGAVILITGTILLFRRDKGKD